MGYKHAEISGRRFMLAIVSESSEIVPPEFAGRMLVAALEETSATGPFSFHYESTDGNMPINGGSHMAVFEQGQAIGIRMRCGEQIENTVLGKLYLPKGQFPQVVRKHLGKALEYLNDDWPEMGINYIKRDVDPSTPPKTTSVTEIPARALGPVSGHAISATTSEPVAGPPRAPVAIPGIVLGDDETIVRGLLKRAQSNGIFPGYVIREYLRRHHYDESNRNYVSDAISRLEEKRVLSRVRVENTGEWQLTESFLVAHGLTIDGYTPLPTVELRRQRGDVSRRAIAAAPQQVATAQAEVLVVSPTTQSVLGPERTSGASPAPAAPSLVPPGEEETYLKVIEHLRELRRLDHECKRLEASRNEALARVRAIDADLEKNEEAKTRSLSFLTGEGLTKLVVIGSSS